jgi:hypothetical protein
MRAVSISWFVFPGVLMRALGRKFFAPSASA